MNGRGKLVTGSISKHLLEMTIPMIWGIFAIIGFNLTDTYFVGQLGKTQLEAMSFTFPVVSIYFSLSIGLGIGASSVIARAAGSGDIQKLRRLATDSLTLALVVVLIFIAIGIATLDQVFRSLGATEEVLPLIREYMMIWYLGMPFLVVPMVGNGAIRALGDSKTPSQIMMIAAVLNVCFDPILIFGLFGFPKLELAGAAIATVVARIFTFVAALYLLIHRENLITFKDVSVKKILHSWRSILYVALPSSATNIITPICAGIVTAMLAKYGAETVAGYAVAVRIEALTIVPILAMSSIIGPFVGQNLGADEHQRLREGVRLTYISSLCWGLLVAVFLAIFGKHITALFSKNPVTIEIGYFYLLVVPCTLGLQGVLFMVNATFNAAGQPLRSTALSVARMFIFYIPPAYFFSQYYGAKGVILGACCSNILAGVCSWLWMRKYYSELTLSK